MRNWLRDHFFNRIPVDSLALTVRRDGRVIPNAWVPIHGGFQILGGKRWTISFMRFGTMTSFEKMREADRGTP